ncbi:MAG TPA: hypothetical protein VFI48_04190 [Hyphomicrobiaceae bacterium]|nr:hypothetical protein [Hyphomicrobiaceae bacterium]
MTFLGLSWATLAVGFGAIELVITKAEQMVLLVQRPSVPRSALATSGLKGLTYAPGFPSRLRLALPRYVSKRVDPAGDGSPIRAAPV